MNKNVLVTGGAGFVGANLVQSLVKKKFLVHVILRSNSSLWRLKNVKEKIIFHEDILLKKERLKTTVKKISPHAIFHLATYGAYPSQNNLQNMINVNIIGTQNLLSVLQNSLYKQLIVTGSSSEYGKKNKTMKETDSLEPNNNYAATKAAQTYLCQVFAKTLHKPLIILRLYNVYGPFEEKGRLVRSVIQSALNGNPIKLATGKEARDFIFIDDVIDICVKAINKTGFYGEIFNIGSGKQTTIYELTQKINSIIGKNSPIKLGAYPGRPWDTYFWKANMAKTKYLLKWQPKISLDEGVKKTILWYKENNEI